MLSCLVLDSSTSELESLAAQAKLLMETMNLLDVYDVITGDRREMGWNELEWTGMRWYDMV